MQTEILVRQRYQMGELLGEGGMGAVFRAFDTTRQEHVAIKRLRSARVTQDATEIERFRREGEALGALNHPNIVKVLDFFQEGDGHYLVMELVQGGSLEGLLARASPLPIERVLSLALDLSDALSRVHHLDIVHRDIKPANVLVQPDGTPRLSDFGVALMAGRERLSASNGIVGTLDYLSPETVAGAAIDAGSDIWSFGVMLFELLAGGRPFSAEHAGATLNAILNAPPPDLEQLRPDCPTGLVDLVYRMLEKDPRRRLSSMRRIGAELESLISGNAPPDVRPRVRPTAFASTLAVAPSRGRNLRLPSQTTPFIGRAGELAELARLVVDAETRLVTVLGPGGMGKSRVAIETARRFGEGLGAFAVTGGADAHAEREVFFAELAPLSHPDLVLSCIAEAVGFRFHPGGEPKTQLLGFLRNRRALLVLDNFEHVLAAAGLVGDIVQAAPNVKVLVTSRQRLGLVSESVFQLAGLAFPAGDIIEASREYSGVQLFLESARRIKRDFALTAQGAMATATICRLVDGLPLGIVLSASWSSVLSPEEIVAEIGRSFEFLSSDMADMPSRQRSLRGVFEYSFGLLTADEGAVFARLAVFRGGFTRASAEAVAGATIQSLAALVNKSLIVRDPTSGRFTIHELLRQYADTKLDGLSGERETTLHAHARYYSVFLSERGSGLKGRKPETTASEIEAELGNIRLAWPLMVRDPDAKSVLGSLATVGLYYAHGSGFADAEEAFSSAATILGDPEPERGSERARALAFALALQAHACHDQWRHAEAVRLSARAASLVDEEADPATAAFALLVWSISLLRTEAVDAGREAGERALLLYEAAGDRWETARALGIYGRCRDWVGAARCEACLLKSIALQRALTGEVVIPDTLVALGDILVDQGKYEEGCRSMNEGLALMERYGDRYGSMLCLQGLASAERKRGNYDDAEAHSRRALFLARDSFPFAETWAHALHGVVLKECGFLDEAESHLRAAMTDGNELACAIATLDLGDIASRRGDLGQASEMFAKALREFERARAAWGVVVALGYLGHLACDQGRYEDADASFRGALGRSLDVGMTPLSLDVVAGIARVRALSNQLERAVELLAFLGAHPITERQTFTRRIDPLLLELSTKLEPPVLAAATERGRSFELEPLLRELSARG